MPTRYHRSTGTAYEVPARTTTRKRTFGANWQNLNSDGVAVTPNRTTTRKRSNSNKKSNSTSAVEYRGNNPMTPFYTGTPRVSNRTTGKAPKKESNSTSSKTTAKTNNGNTYYDRLTDAQKRRVNHQVANYEANNRIRGVGRSELERQKQEFARRELAQQSNNNRQFKGNGYGGSWSNSKNTTTAPKNKNNQSTKSTSTPQRTAVPANTVSVANSSTASNNTSQQNTKTVKQAPAKLSNKVGNTPAKSNKPTTHTIARGETLSGIAKRYGVDWRQLAKDNGIEDPNMIIAGRKLNINGSTKTPKKNKPRRSIRTTPTTDTRVLTNPAFTPVTPSISSNISIPGVESGFRTPEEILSGI